MTTRRSLATPLAGLILLVGTGALAAQETPVTPAQARAIAKEAYICGFPLADSYRILYAWFVDREDSEYKAPWNQIENVARVYTPDDRAVQTPNTAAGWGWTCAPSRRCSRCRRSRRSAT